MKHTFTIWALALLFSCIGNQELLAQCRYIRQIFIGADTFPSRTEIQAGSSTVIRLIGEGTTFSTTNRVYFSTSNDSIVGTLEAIELTSTNPNVLTFKVPCSVPPGEYHILVVGGGFCDSPPNFIPYPPYLISPLQTPKITITAAEADCANSRLISVNPDNVPNCGGGFIRLTAEKAHFFTQRGVFFSTSPDSISVDTNGFSLKAIDVRVLTNNVLEFKVPDGTPPGTYYIIVNDGGSQTGPPAKNFPVPIEITIFDQVPTTANAGPDQTICADTTSLSGNTPIIGTGYWVFISGAGAIANPFNPKTKVSKLKLGVNRLKWIIINGACPESSDEVLITYNPVPISPSIGPDVRTCIDSVALSANVDGNWSILSGSGFFTDISSKSTMIKGLAPGIIRVRYATVATTCPAEADTLNIFYDPLAAGCNGAELTSVTPEPVEKCKNSIIRLRGAATEFRKQTAVILSTSATGIVGGFPVIEVNVINDEELTFKIPSTTPDDTYYIYVENGGAYTGTPATDYPKVIPITLIGGSCPDAKLQTITPSPVTKCEPRTITITGVNTQFFQYTDIYFSTSSTSIVGSIKAINVKVLSDTRLTMELPPDAPVGTFFVIVENGGNQAGPPALNFPEPVEITITATSGGTPIVGGKIIGSTTVCANGNSGILKLKDYSGRILRWESSTDNFGAVINTIENYTDSLIYNDLTTTTQFRAVVGACGSVNSAPVTVTVQAGTAVGGRVTTDQTFCTGKGTGSLNLSGSVGNVIRWESSANDFATITTIANTNPTFDFTDLTSTLQFRAVLEEGGCTTFSRPATITISTTPTPGTLGQDRTVCAGVNTGKINLIGLLGGTVVAWESSTDNFESPGTLIANTTTSLTFNNLSQTTYYRVRISNGICDTLSDTIKIQTIFTGLGGQVRDDQTICGFPNVGILSLTGHSGTIVRWESSIDDFTNLFTTIRNTTTVHNFSNLTTTTCFRAMVQGPNLSCPPVPSVPACVTINTSATGGYVVGGKVVCEGGSTGVLRLKDYRGNIIRWERSLDCIFFTSAVPIANTVDTLAPETVTNTTCYRAVLEAAGCPTVFSAPVKITVNRLIVSASAPPVVGCGTGSTVTTLVSGGNPPFRYSLFISSLPDNTTGIFENVPSGPYEVRIIDALGCSKSAVVNIVDNAGLAKAEILSINEITAGSAVVLWSEVPPTSTRYNLRYRIKGCSPWVELKNIYSTGSPIWSLQHNTVYEVSVQHVCESGFESPWSDTKEFATVDLGDCSVAPRPVPGSICIKNITPTSVTISWNPVPGAGGYYLSLGLAMASPGSWPNYNICAPASEYTVTGLNPGRPYRFRLRTNCNRCTVLDLTNMSIPSRLFEFSTLLLREETDDIPAYSFKPVVYPNPNKGNFTIEFDAEDHELTHIVVKDLMARLISYQKYETEVGLNQVSIQLPEVSKGVYILEVRRGKNQFSERIIIE